MKDGGFRNLGNTCYLNASLQLVLSSPSCRREVVDVDEKTAVLSLKASVSRALCEKRVPALVDLIRSIRKRFPQDFRPMQQNDAHEFLQLLLDKLGEEEQEAVKNGSSLRERRGRIGRYNARLEPYEALCSKMDADRESQNLDRRDLARTTCIQLLSQVKCLACDRKSHYSEFMNVLPLELRPSIDDSLRAFFSSETIRQWRCERCGADRLGAKKTYRAWGSPECLFVVLKRFSPAGNKARSRVFPNARIYMHEHDISPPLMTKTPEWTHALVGFVCHFGRDNRSGHYVAYRRFRDVWVCYDDERVCTCCEESEDDLLARHASDVYLLAYERRTGDK